MEEWTRLRQDFEREASRYHNLQLMSYFITRERTAGGEKDFAKPNHAIMLYQYFGNVTTEDLKNFRTPELAVFGVIIGDQTELFRRMAVRAGSLFPDDLRIMLLHAVSDKFLNKDKPGKPVHALNRDPLATWLMFILITSATIYPNRTKNASLRVDPFAASLTAIDFILDSTKKPSTSPGLQESTQSKLKKSMTIGKLLNIYRRLSFMQKLGFWGSVASIISFLLFFYPFHANSVSDGGHNATTHGPESPAIGENKGNININYNNAPSNILKGYVLRNSKNGATLVVSTPSINAAHDSSKHVCLAVAGTPVVLLGETSKNNDIDMWQKIRITNGQCSNKVGWAATENISYE